MHSSQNQSRLAEWDKGLILGRTLVSPRLPMGFSTSVPAKNGADDLITYAGDGHLITLAPTGTGKSSGPVICNALKHPGQLIVLDIKGEIYRATAETRRKLGPVYVLDLHDNSDHSDSLNPFDLARFGGTETAAIARTLATDLIQRAEERDRFWNDMAETVIAGAIAHLMDDTDKASQNLSGIFDLFNADDVTYKIAVMLDCKAVKNKSAHKAFACFLNLPERETRPAVLGTIQTHLRLFDSQLIARLTKSTSIDLAALIAGTPVSIYIIVPPHRLEAFKPVLRIWISGLIMALTHRTKPALHRTLMLCDEIGNLGRLDAFLMASTLMRSWGLTLWSFWQNAAQLEAYGKQARTLVDNAAVVQVFGARNRRMAQEFVDLLGGFTADDIINMGPREQLLLIEGGTPQKAKQVRYFDDRMFTDDFGR